MTEGARALRDRATEALDRMLDSLATALGDARNAEQALNDSRHYDLAHLTVVDTRRLTETAEAHDGGASQASTERRADT